ncbi:MAG: ribbon-helix-helix protein, CopG family [Schwartzia sp.]|nr:ribbon-helix-helix protein, CopG family [Schwartzia sp. (in: firmicutes)]
MKDKLVITKKNPRGVDGYKIFSIRIRDDTLDRINALSDRTGRTRNELIGMLLEYALENSEVSE